MKIKRSYYWAGAVTIAIGVWMGSGLVQMPEPAPEQETKAETDRPFRVEVRRISSRQREARLVMRGRTEAFRRVDARARTAGIVEEVAVDEGRTVKAGDLLCRLDMASRYAQLAEAKAKLKSAELELKVADDLVKQKFASKTRQASDKAKFDAAQSAVELMQREMSYTKITAPIDGLIDTRPAEPGSFLQVGSVCARVLVLDPLLIVGQVSEREIAALTPGMNGTANLVTGETVEGTIRHVATSADAATRTFRVELAVPNPGKKLRDGVTSDVTIPLATKNAHKFSPAVLTLNDNGEIGVRVVDASNIVRFAPVKILADDKDGIWVAGLPETVTLITVGQEYVTEGQKVEPVHEAASLVEETVQ